MHSSDAEITKETEVEDKMVRALSRAIEPDIVREGLKRAYESEHISTLPGEPAALHFFLTGTLRRVMVEELEVTCFDELVEPLARRLVASARARRASEVRVRQRGQRGGPGTRSGVIPAVRQILVVSADPTICDAIEQLAQDHVAVSRVESLFDFAPLLDIGADNRGAVIVDAPTTPIALPTLARTAHVVPPNCPVVVLGLTEPQWKRVAALFPTLAEWDHAEDLEALDLSHRWSAEAPPPAEAVSIGA